MGGERASTVRQREAGKICCSCGVQLDRPPAGHKPGYRAGERHCSRCEPRPHHLRMRFELCLGKWRVTVSELSGRTLRQITFATADKVEEMAERGHAFRDLADRQAVEHALRSPAGLGICDLHLTCDQFNELRKRP